MKTSALCLQYYVYSLLFSENQVMIFLSYLAKRRIDYYTFFYKQLVYKQLALSLKISKQLWGLNHLTISNNIKLQITRNHFQKMTVCNAIRSNLHCSTKATKQSKSLIFSRNSFEQSEKLLIWLTKKSWENTRKIFIRPHY